ncbi:hypothetical protein WR25_26952 [Diploscapter pachys]|uniref:dolichyl-phosphate-mannose--protein mannosyltransferase n=1 Tax=Diploscapter pachys TaxID=2018661 RepID=A0A2A2LNF5_9BILA|nr:hypothetical protein WR25_26952 [Diploscapter pachys]
MKKFLHSPVNKKRMKDVKVQSSHPENSKGLPIHYYFLPFVASILVYSNAFDAQFVYDDRIHLVSIIKLETRNHSIYTPSDAAIVSNADVTGQASIWEVFKNDFWGNPVANEGSHKSYRPLVTLSFRINHYFHGLKPYWYHVTNIILHGITSITFVKVARDHLSKNALLFSSLLFAVHPIHTEAVSGLVGRADVMATLLILVGILIYQQNEDPLKSVMITSIAMLCKETGVALPLILGVSTILFSKQDLHKKRSKCLKLAVGFITLCILRMAICNFQSPKFSSHDNPVANEKDFWVRTMTFLYLPLLHFRLLVFPDARDKSTSSLLFSIAILCLPHLLASNLISYVGFVVAERILYLPSVGYCMLLGFLLETLQNRIQNKAILLSATIVILSLHSVKTWSRNYDWKNDEALYKSGIEINPTKALANLGHIYALGGRKAEAEDAYRKALSKRPNMADTWYNFGILLKENGRLQEAKEAYETVLFYRNSFAAAYTNLGLLQWELGNKTEAERLFDVCAKLETTFVKSYSSHIITQTNCMYNKGRLLSSDGRFHRAIEAYHKALQIAPPTYTNFASLYNTLGEAYMKLGDDEKAEFYYDKALSISPLHVNAFLTMAHLRMRQNRSQDANDLFHRALTHSNASATVYYHIGVAKTLSGNIQEAEENYKLALEKDSNHSDALQALCNLLRESGKVKESETIAERLAIVRPDFESFANYGAILHLNRKYDEAEIFYNKALQLRKDDETTLKNLEKLKRARAKI